MTNADNIASGQPRLRSQCTPLDKLSQSQLIDFEAAYVH